MRSALCTPDGIFLVVQLSLYSNVGDQRLKLQYYLTGVPPTSCSNFITFDKWVGLIHAVRAVGVSLPDASLVWTAFMRMIVPMREECSTIEHCVQNFLLQNSDSILATDEIRVLEMIQTVSSRILSLLETGTLVFHKPKVAAPKAALQQGAAKANTPQLLQAKTKPGPPKSSRRSRRLLKGACGLR